jgi:hypothetical protein
MAGCDNGPPRRSVWDISWDDVRHWSELSCIIARRDEIDEVVFVSSGHETALRGSDARAIIDGLAPHSTCPIIDLTSRKSLGRLVLRAKGTDLAEIQCFDKNVFSFKEAYVRSTHDVLGQYLIEPEKKLR